MIFFRIPGHVNMDFSNVGVVMENAGSSLMGIIIGPPAAKKVASESTDNGKNAIGPGKNKIALEDEDVEQISNDDGCFWHNPESSRRGR
ncbi:hypothetical protein L1887_08696 [Cichorium endivia]|nr:hypothetical protein L1887_08696 [Cichorium endivia]